MVQIDDHTGFLPGVVEGDWESYHSFLKLAEQPQNLAQIVAEYGSVASYKRVCALAYVGNQQKLHGRDYRSDASRVFTPDTLYAIALSNRQLRTTRPNTVAMSARF